MTRHLAVLVTGVGGAGIGEQILKALRLSTLDLTIVGTDATSASKGLHEVDVPHVIPRADDPGYLDALLDVCRRHAVKAVFPGSEPELLTLCRHAGRVAQEGIYLAANPTSVVELCLDKAACTTWLLDRGFLCPRSVTVSKASDLALVDFFPAVLKPRSGAGGSSDVFIATDRGELHFYGTHLLGQRGGFIAQEYVGTPDAEFTVGVLCAPDGSLMNAIAIRRDLGNALSRRFVIENRSGRTELGPRLVISSGISQGEIGPFPEVVRECREMAVALGCTAAVNVQCRFVGGRPTIFEINPRFSGTTSLRAMAGYNEPEELLRCAVLGQAPRRDFAYRSGRIYRGLQEVADFGAHAGGANA
jgi:carbamoyl-phosphate synthase large subunit